MSIKISVSFETASHGVKNRPKLLLRVALAAAYIRVMLKDIKANPEAEVTIKTVDIVVVHLITKKKKKKKTTKK